MQVKFNWLAVLVAAIAGMFIGFLWYGVFFQAQWAEAVGLTGPGLTEAGGEVFKHGEPVTLDPILPMVINIITMAIYAVILTWLTTKAGATSFASGAKLGLLIGVIAMLARFTSNRFAMEPTFLSVIDGTYYLVLFAAIGAIVGGWRKK